MNQNYYCSGCGHGVTSSQKYCSNCGKALSHEKGNHNNKINATINTIHSSVNKVAKVPKLLLLIAIVALLIIIFVNTSKNSPTEVVENLIEYSQDSEWEKGKEPKMFSHWTLGMIS